MPLTRGTPWSPATTRSRTSSTGSRGRAGAFSTRSSTLRPTISSASSSLLVSAVLRCATMAPARMTLTWSVTAMISRSLWVIRTMVRPCALQVAQDPEEMIGLLRREHARGLVQDQDVRAAEQGLEDLDPLLDADRQAGHGRVEIDLEAVVALECRHLGAGAPGTVGQGEAALRAEQQVLQDRERLDQHEVLVDHADPGLDRVLRALDHRGPRRRPGSRRCRPGRTRRGCSSGSTCRRRSRRRCRGSSRPGRPGRCGGWRGRGRSACRSRAARPPGAAPPAAA